jgi:hypothetical protein
MGKGSGGGGPQYSEVKQSTSNLPDYARPYYEDLLARTGYETSLPYQPYQGDRLAYFSPMEQSAMQGYGELGMSGTPPELDAAGRSAYDLMQGWDQGPVTSGYKGSSHQAGSLGMDYNPETRESGYTATEYDPSSNYKAQQREMGFEAGSLGAEGALDPYMDPYYQNVVDVEKREASRQADMRHATTGLDAAGLGSLGGYREAIMRSEAERNLGTQMGDIQTKGSQAAYKQALQSFEADRGARAQEEQFGQSQFASNEGFRQREAELMQQGYSLSEASRMAEEEFGQSQYGMNQQALQAKEQFSQNRYNLEENMKLESFRASEQAKQEAARLGLSAAQIEQAGQIAMAQSKMQATGMLGDFANQRQGMELERLSAMEQAGLKERGLMQQGLDTGYQDYLRQQAYPRENLNFMAQMMYGMPVQPGTTTATYGPQPTAAQQLIGSGIAGAGLYNAYKGG